MAASSRGRFEDLGVLEATGIAPRRVRAFVPRRRRGDGGQPAPLLVMFDGQNIFDDAGSFAGGWHVHDVVERRAQTRRSPAPIVVGIDHGGGARLDELAPLRDPKHGGGKLPVLVDAIIGELLPRVDAQLGAPAVRYIGGSSLGGLAALYAHLVHPDVFAGALAMSPSLWFTRARVAALLHRQPRPAHSRIYVDCGGREGADMWAPIEAFAERLRTRGWSDVPTRSAHRLKVRYAPHGKHEEAAWRRRFPEALRFLLAR